MRFVEGKFKNGADPYSMHHTLTKGYGQMVAQPQYATGQKYAVIHYIRETFLKEHIRSQYIAQKCFAVRLDDGDGVVTKGRAWMIYDHDTMRAAAATTADYIVWKGIAFDGSHGSKHFDEHTWEVHSMKSTADPCTILLDIPALALTDCYELVVGERISHGTIHALQQP